ncbi:Hypothetical Protein FCC1311_096942 [Hondaea fermentalgiana]|uniref:F-box domain-containing protein n=1 Tax=Hondaea fermentalgiana TaxID=2315210 RepID=A0A2R5GYD8_9STRA|nr:Hypothetical Protein FCC1311_096942 [Hondaea fermentalgiana]|eukprot:GBG33471.1 Hypothetical Protein FCC1311_096942 [Hondaea fermentalgiana]
MAARRVGVTADALTQSPVNERLPSETLHAVLEWLSPLQLIASANLVCKRWEKASNAVLAATAPKVRAEIDHGNARRLCLRCSRSLTVLDECPIPVRINKTLAAKHGQQTKYGAICWGKTRGSIAAVIQGESCIHLLRVNKRGKLQYSRMIPLKAVNPVGIAFLRKRDRFAVADAATPALLVISPDGHEDARIMLSSPCTSLALDERGANLSVYLTCDAEPWAREPQLDLASVNLAALARDASAELYALRPTGSLVRVNLLSGVVETIQTDLCRPVSCALSATDSGLYLTHFVGREKRALVHIETDARVDSTPLSIVATDDTKPWHVLDTSQDHPETFPLNVFSALAHLPLSREREAERPR